MTARGCVSHAFERSACPGAIRTGRQENGTGAKHSPGGSGFCADIRRQNVESNAHRVRQFGFGQRRMRRRGMVPGLHERLLGFRCTRVQS